MKNFWPHTLLARLLKGVREEGGMRASFHPPILPVSRSLTVKEITTDVSGSVAFRSQFFFLFFFLLFPFGLSICLFAVAAC